MRHAWLSVALIGLVVPAGGCSSGFDPTYTLTCPAALPAGMAGSVSMAYTSFDPIAFEWRIDPMTAGTFGEAETPATPTNETEPMTVGTQFNASQEGTAKIFAFVDGVEVASCDATILPANTQLSTLTVVVVGMGSVTGDKGNLDCPGTCAADLPVSTQVTLSPTAAANWGLDRVSGGCMASGSDYVVTIADDVTCTFTFVDTTVPPTDTEEVASGSFTRGCAACPNDTPMGTVTLTKDFAIDTHEVTVAEYQACVGAGNCTEPGRYDAAEVIPCNFGAPGRDDHPINCVTWDQAKAYCEAEGRSLPTEAQWERAARGRMDARVYAWGDEAATCDLANVILVPFERCSATGTSSVALHPTGASPDGVEDMIGNVQEWVLDWYGASYYNEPASQVDPQGPDSGSTRMVRGGAFSTIATIATVYDRTQHSLPTTQDPQVGFRCVTTLP